MNKKIYFGFIFLWIVILACTSKDSSETAEVQDQEAAEDTAAIAPFVIETLPDSLQNLFLRSGINPNELCSCEDIYEYSFKRRDPPHPTAEWHVHQEELQATGMASPPRRAGKLIVAESDTHEVKCFMPFFNTATQSIDKCDHIDKSSANIVCLPVKINNTTVEVAIAFNVRKDPRPTTPHAPHFCD